VSRWENAPSLRDLARLMGVMVDLYCAGVIDPNSPSVSPLGPAVK
jgi:hypothetical protein